MPITWSLVMGAIAAALLVPATAAGAADAEASGWWTASPLAVAPDAEDALVVQGGLQADQPTSYAAVQFTLGDGESASRLLLRVAPSSASTPEATLTVCPLTGSFVPADGGAMADAPRYDCAITSSATATDGVYSFDVSALAATDGLSLAILPGAPSDRVVLSKPGPDALETSVVGTSTGNDVVDPGTSSGGDTVPVDTFIPPATSTDSFDPPAMPAPTVGSISGPSTDGAAGSAGSERSVVVDAAPASSTDDGRPLAPLVFVFLVLLAAVLWLAASRMSDLTELAEI